jgi:hypothetical protein
MHWRTASRALYAFVTFSSETRWPASARFQATIGRDPQRAQRYVNRVRR